MRLTGPVGLGIRALLSAGITGATLLASAYVMTVFGAAFVLFVAVQLGPIEFTERSFLWTVGLSALPILPCFGLAVARGVRLERRQLLERTVPVAEIDAAEARALAETATRLAKQFDVTTPEVRLHPGETPVAYTTPRPGDPIVAVCRRGSPIVVVSTGLVRTLSRAETDAVLAHEFAHLANDDLQLTSWLLVPLFAAEFLDDTAADETRRIDPLGWALTSVGLIGVGVFLRGRELAADRAAAEATGDPGALAAALEGLDRRRSPRPTTDLRTRARSTNAINVCPTLEGVGGETGSLRSTHPPLEARLEALRSMAAERGA